MWIGKKVKMISRAFDNLTRRGSEELWTTLKKIPSYYTETEGDQLILRGGKGTTGAQVVEGGFAGQWEPIPRGYGQAEVKRERLKWRRALLLKIVISGRLYFEAFQVIQPVNQNPK